MSWLPSVAAVSTAQRRRSRTSRSSRSRTSDSPLQTGGGRRKIPVTHAANRAAAFPSRNAAVGLRNAATASATMAAPATALTAAITAVDVESWPVAKTRMDPMSG